MSFSEKVKVLVAQSGPTLCHPVDYMGYTLGSSVHGISQARILEWVAIPSQRDLPFPEIEPRYSVLKADSLPSEPPGKPLISFKEISNVMFLCA